MTLQLALISEITWGIAANGRCGPIGKLKTSLDKRVATGYRILL